ncbi:hypothetical protein BJY16_003102 [Actinoplanes octamycinicus]|uniref:Uncharacterized protein n=1 Tax=Actinoplanes octamycinicus TaxID=135948 RepID=A0A7W7GWL8_9ACTN|nr:hypothetical protein [Actinoplanes octamycinicus]MBB4739643.1 hypothetical protein [Actinoplanes octamycinicus]GIE54826.1 hypothetical protein Aoc01nite_02280 [Actinoplanes octamycinicus]
MIERLTFRWRREVAEQEAAVAAGTLAREEAYALNSFPADFVTRVDAALTRYEQDLAALEPANDAAAWAAVERVVTALNAADSGEIETVTREELCEYIDDALADAGVDVDALTSRRGMDRSELTDDWRDW